MVPFWRRRLLVVTLPASLATTALAFGMLCLMIDYLRTRVIMRGASVFEPMWIGTALLGLAACSGVAVSLIPFGRPRSNSRLGIGYWFSRTASSIRSTAFVFMLSQLTLGYFVSLTGTTLALLALPAAAILIGFGMSIGTGRVRPRERALGDLERRHAMLAAVILALALPFAAVLSKRWDTNAENIDHDLQSTLTSIGLQIAILFLTTSLLAAWFARQLRLRHAPYHARHCHSCGYDLLGTESPACPECDHPISPERSQHLRNEPLA